MTGIFNFVTIDILKLQVCLIAVRLKHRHPGKKFAQFYRIPLGK